MLDALKTPTGAYNLTLIVSGIIWILSGIGIFAGFNMNRVKAIDAQAKTAEAEAATKVANERTEATEAELRETKNKLAIVQKKLEPRRLSASQIQTMTLILGPSPRQGHIDIIVPLSSGDDAMAFALDIYRLLKPLGFDVSEPINAAFTPMVGLVLQGKDRSMLPRAGGFIQQAFNEIGYDCEGVLKPSILDTNDVELIIGSRP
jgi:hypothetical protein